MALPMPLPGWIVTQPTDFAHAATSGMQAGLEAARMWQAGRMESARLAQAQKLADLKAEVEREDQKRNFILGQQKLIADQEYQRARIGQAQAETAAATQTAGQRAAAAASHYQQMQALQQHRGEAQAAHYGQMEAQQAQRRDAEQQRLEIERQRLVNAGQKKTDPLEAQLAAYAAGKTAPAAPTGPGIGQRIKDFIVSGRAPMPATAPAVQGSPARLKVARAQAISAMHPDWSKADVIKAVNDEFNQDSSGVAEPESDEEQ